MALKNLSVKVDPGLYRALEVAAAANDQTLSEWLRGQLPKLVHEAKAASELPVVVPKPPVLPSAAPEVPVAASPSLTPEEQIAEAKRRRREALTVHIGLDVAACNGKERLGYLVPGLDMLLASPEQLESYLGNDVDERFTEYSRLTKIYWRPARHTIDTL